MSIVGFDAPDFRTISEFRKRHSKALSALFQLEALAATVKAGKDFAVYDAKGEDITRSVPSPGTRFDL
jgi:polyhydroxyalkanoate synthesis regulator protein